MEIAETKPRSGQELELDVDALAQGGRGIARANGYVVFVTGALPGDRVRVRLTKTKRAYAEGRAVELITPSADRIADTCVHEGEPCPGAPWQGLPYERQLAEKAAQVDDALRRLGKLDGYELEPIEPAIDAVALPQQGASTRSASAPTRSPSAFTAAAAGRKSSTSTTATSPRRPTTPPATPSAGGRTTAASLPTTVAVNSGTLRNLVVREGRRTGQIQTRLVTSPDEIPQPPVDLHTVIEGLSGRHRRANRSARLRTPGRGALRPALPRLAHRLHADQHRDGRAPLRDRRRLRRALRHRAPLRPLLRDRHDRPLARLARRARSGASRASPEAVGDAEVNAAENGIANAQFVCADARLGITPLLERAGRPDVVVVDPPRSGLSKKIVRRLLETEAPRIVYVSCNPTTLAPNAAQIVEAGYTLRRVKPVDMFPQTPHVEAVAVFEQVSERGKGSASPPGSTRTSRGPLAERCAQLGYGSMWSNDHPGALGWRR